MSSHYTTVNNNYIIVNTNFNDCIINLCGFRFFLGQPVLKDQLAETIREGLFERAFVHPVELAEFLRIFRYYLSQ